MRWISWFCWWGSSSRSPRADRGPPPGTSRRPRTPGRPSLSRALDLLRVRLEARLGEAEALQAMGRFEEALAAYREHRRAPRGGPGPGRGAGSPGWTPSRRSPARWPDPQARRPRRRALRGALARRPRSARPPSRRRAARSRARRRSGTLARPPTAGLTCARRGRRRGRAAVARGPPVPQRRLGGRRVREVVRRQAGAARARTGKARPSTTRASRDSRSAPSWAPATRTAASTPSRRSCRRACAT